jgi:ferritin-like metal-binding protein YciE
MKSNGKNSSAKGKTNELKTMTRSSLMELFENELKDIYWAEKHLTKALPRMAKSASDAGLSRAIEKHLKETERQVRKVESVFEILGKKAVAKKCEAMAGLIKEGQEIMKETEKGPQRDAGIISAAQKVEHYEIASYGTLRTFAATMGLDKAVEILEEILEEEKNADVTLTQVAESSINVEAVMEEDE